MKLTLLTDNHTIIDRYFLGEPALSILLEEDDKTILFDTGYSGVFTENADRLGIHALENLDAVVLSHGHNDHTGGLPFLWEKYDLSAAELTACPGVFAKREYEGLQVGSPVTQEECEAHGLSVHLSRTPVKLTDRLTFLGELPRVMPFESVLPIGMVTENGTVKEDYVTDDSALVYRGQDGLFIITGCSHSGICNIISYAKSLPGNEGLPVTGVIGGFHLMKNDVQLKETVKFLKENVKGTLYPCHCVSLYAKHCMIAAGLPVEEAGAGMCIEVN